MSAQRIPTRSWHKSPSSMGSNFFYFNLNVPITDDGFKYSGRMKELKHVSMPIRGSKLTAASLESLKGLTGLRGILLHE